MQHVNVAFAKSAPKALHSKVVNVQKIRYLWIILCGSMPRAGFTASNQDKVVVAQAAFLGQYQQSTTLLNLQYSE